MMNWEWNEFEKKLNFGNSKVSNKLRLKKNFKMQKEKSFDFFRFKLFESQIQFFFLDFQRGKKFF